MLYQILKKGKGEKIETGNYIKVNVVVYQKDSISFNSYEQIPAIMQVDTVTQAYDVTEVFPLLHVGDSVEVIQLIDSIAKIKEQPLPPNFKKGDKIKFYIRVEARYKSMEEAQKAYNDEVEKKKVQEIKDVEDYLKKNKINAGKTSLGTYIEILNPGQTPLPDSGKLVSVKYTGMNFSGKKFDSNVDTTFGHTDLLNVTIGSRGVIPGFEDGLKAIGKGGKAKVYIPSMMAYGPAGSPPIIKPFENLIFEIEIVDIKQAPKPEPIPQLAPPSGTQGNK